MNTLDGVGFYKEQLKPDEMKHQAVPVVMYHNVGVDNSRWIWNHLTCQWDLFERHLMCLKKNRIHAISLQQLYDYREGRIDLPGKSVVLTFDDGYLDNWVFAYPLLKKHGFKGTIFINPEFVDLRSVIRKNLFDVWNDKANIDNLETEGFLSWQEMDIMESEGVMDMQSHSMSHTWYFTDDNVIDFHHPGNVKYPWLFWNARPDKKSLYLNETQETFVPYGTPVYTHGRSLGIKRYLEDKDLSRRLAGYAKEQGEVFFKERDWKDKLLLQVKCYKSEVGDKGRYETGEEQVARYRYELMESKRILEDKLHKKVNFLCWPGGAYNDLTLRLAKEAGYLSTTLLFDAPDIKNTIAEDTAVINRTGCCSSFYWHNMFFPTDAGFFIANVKYFQGARIYLWIMRLYKIKYLVSFFLKKIVRGG